jgi:hypothetical protein
MNNIEFIPHPNWSILMEPSGMTFILKKFINWCLFNQLPIPQIFSQRSIDINGNCLYDIPFTKYNAYDGTAGFKNIYRDFFK